jgi:hypothetical protein
MSPSPALTPPRAAAVAGVVFAVLMSTSLILVRLAVPAGFRSDPGRWLTDPVRRNAVKFAIQLAPFAGIAFLWFIGVLRNRLGKLEDQFFATVFLGSGLLFVTSLFASIAFSGALIDTVASGNTQIIDTGTYYLARQFIAAFTNVFGIKMAGVFTFSTSMVIFRTGILPRWVAFLGFSCGVVLLLAVTSWPWITLLFPFWILVVSLRVLLAEFRPAEHAKID